MATPLPILLMTRPRPAAQKVIAALQARGAGFVPIVSPLLEIVPVGQRPDLTGYRGVIFTSANGVMAFCALGGVASGPAYCVGAATALAASAAGFDVWSADGDAHRLVDELRMLKPPTPLLHLRGQHTRGEVAEKLSRLGHRTESAVVYDQQEMPLSDTALGAISGGIPVIAPLYSPRTAAILASYPRKAPFSVAAMSEAVANAFGPLHKQRLRVAARPESDAMLDQIVSLLRRAGESLN